MARKPRSQWSPEYRRRVEAAERKGKTGPAARGHKAHEHVERAIRERARRGGFTAYQQQKIHQWAVKTAGRVNTLNDIRDGSRRPITADEVELRLKAWTAERGFDRFNELKRAVKAREKIKRRRVRIRRGRIRIEMTGRSEQLDAMEDDFAAFGLPGLGDDIPDYAWFFYH